MPLHMRESNCNQQRSWSLILESVAYLLQASPVNSYKNLQVGTLDPCRANVTLYFPIRWRNTHVKIQSRQQFIQLVLGNLKNTWRVSN